MDAVEIIMEILERIAINFRDDPLGDISAIATIVILGVTVIIYFAGRNADKARDRAERDADRFRAYKNLYFEIYGTLQAIRGVSYPDDNKEVEIEGPDGDMKTIYFTNRLFNHDFYDSLINSGRIDYLETILQQNIQNVFRLIKAHNKYLDIIIRAPSPVTHSTEELLIAKEQNQRYFEWMSDTEDMLRDEIPPIMEKLESMFKTA